MNMANVDIVFTIIYSPVNDLATDVLVIVVLTFPVPTNTIYTS